VRVYSQIIVMTPIFYLI